MLHYTGERRVATITEGNEKMKYPEYGILSPSMNIAIPQIDEVKGWRATPVNETSEPLIVLNAVESGMRIRVESQYALMGFPHSSTTQFCRKQVASRLFAAAASLPAGIEFKIWDAWRPLQLQQYIFNRHLLTLSQPNPGLPNDELIAMCEQFVSQPSSHSRYPSPHYTGGAIDLTLVGPDGKELWMGTEYDEFLDKARTRFYEAEENVSEYSDLVAQRNRRLLFHSMSKAGFTNYSEEWWHFDYGNQFWATILGLVAIYGPIEPHT